MKFIKIFIILSSLALLQNKPCNSFPSPDKVEKVRKEIKLLNLINGLELSQQQMGYILEQAKEATKIKHVFEERIQEKSTDGYEIYTDLRKVLMQGKEISEPLKRRVHLCNKSERDLKKQFENKINSLAVNIKDKLQGYQLYVLDQFKPCLIPPDNTIRIGQIKDSKGFEKQLDRIRTMPDRAFVKRKDKAAGKTLEIIKKHLPKGYMIEEEQEKTRILAIYKKSRELSDIDYSLKKDEIVKELTSKFALPKLPIDITVKIERHFLAPEIVQLLKEKLEMK